MPDVLDGMRQDELRQRKIDEISVDRGKEYGDYRYMCSVIQKIKIAMSTGRNWNDLSDAQREALELIATKIGRILNGNRNNRDSWEDIAGYARLAHDTLPIDEEECLEIPEFLRRPITDTQPIDEEDRHG